jgi:cytochrome c oxidase accessory protein FixG
MYTDVSTIDKEGNRKYIYPLIEKGKWYKKRRALAYALVAWLLIAPWTSINGKQTLFFDIVNLKLDAFGFTFWANESIVLISFIFLFISIILLLTAIYGRVFCGWACPQTVFMEFVFRPIENLLEGVGFDQRQYHSLPFLKRWKGFILKWSLFTFISFILGNTFVAYFFGSHNLLGLIAGGPSSHWGAFISMLIVTGIFIFQFGWFREQICTFLCPYGRLQSILLDNESTIVAYDEKRGEPRGKPKHVTGDCVDCKMCVKVCPTGIDIRQGLQMECIHCTQCIDACNRIMHKLDRAPNLIGYKTLAELGGKKKKILRPRLFIYGLMIFASAAILLSFSAGRSTISATIHRESGRDLFTLTDTGTVINPLRVQLSNRADSLTRIDFKPNTPVGLEIDVPQGMIILQGQEKRTVFILLKLPMELFENKNGVTEVEFNAVDKQGNEVPLKLQAFGPIN